MRSSIVIPVLLGAGAIAHPHYKLNNPLAHVHHKRQQPAEVVTSTLANGEVEIEDIFVEYVYGNAVPTTTPTTPPPTTTPVPTTTAAAVNAPEKLEVAPVVNNQPSITPSITPAPTSTPAPVQTSAAPVSSPAASSGGDDGAPNSNGVSILETANKYRSMMGYPFFTYDQTLQANAVKTVSDDHGDQMTHELNPGSLAQCLAEVDNLTGDGTMTSFEFTYLGWLCEIDDSRLGGRCDEMENATHMIVNKSDPGHAQILRTASYTKMGCGYQTASTKHDDGSIGLWGCDFA